MRRIPALRRIGLDLDNTIVDYAALIREEVVALGVLDVIPAGDKRAVRDALRVVPEGESHWTRLQARIYGERMDAAVPFPGAIAFIERARSNGIEVVIVSHKSEVAATEVQGPNLREAARRWLASQGIVGPLGISPESVYFEATRAAKTARIATLGLDVFVDDLVEVFVEPGFPVAVQRWLFAPGPLDGDPPVDRHFGSWDAIERAVFGAD